MYSTGFFSSLSGSFLSFLSAFGLYSLFGFSTSLRKLSIVGRTKSLFGSGGGIVSRSVAGDQTISESEPSLDDGELSGFLGSVLEGRLRMGLDELIIFECHF